MLDSIVWSEVGMQEMNFRILLGYFVYLQTTSCLDKYCIGVQSSGPAIVKYLCNELQNDDVYICTIRVVPLDKSKNIKKNEKVIMYFQKHNQNLPINK